MILKVLVMRYFLTEMRKGQPARVGLLDTRVGLGLAALAAGDDDACGAVL